MILLICFNCAIHPKLTSINYYSLNPVRLKQTLTELHQQFEYFVSAKYNDTI
jgi:hypothetical protein